MVRLNIILNISRSIKGAGFRVQIKNKPRASGHTVGSFDYFHLIIPS